jgi:hypothetical protein
MNNYMPYLIRTDRVLDDATKQLASQIATGTGKRVFAGNPFYK